MPFRPRKMVIPLTLLSLAACQLHSVNTSPTPQITLDSTYTKHIADSPGTEVYNVSWWKAFNRSTLDKLVTKAFESNQDIKQALARVRRAGAIYTQTNAGMLPVIDVTSSSDLKWEGTQRNRDGADIGTRLSWEIDAFSRISSATKADAYEVKARTEDVEALKLIISTDIANAYFGAVTANQTLRLLKDQLKTDRALLDLLELRRKNGVGTNVDVLQQQSRVAESESLIPVAESQLRTFENRLDVLVGQQPDDVHRVPTDDSLDFAEPLPALGVPADLLLHRPDLRAAKAGLIAADADIAEAIANRLPRITLTGSFLYDDSGSFSGPVSAVAGAFVQPLLDWGKRKAMVSENKAVYEERLAKFTQIYLEAIEDVENALYQENRQREFIRRLEKRLDILRKTLSETEARYSEGVDDYLPVLSALQELRVVERNLVNQHQTLINLRIRLYNAVGAAVKTSEKE